MLRTIQRQLLGAAMLLALVTSAQAAFIEVTVDARTGPWNWTAGGLNDDFRYGPATQDFLAPVVVNLSSIGSGVGNDLYIAYKSGLTNAFGGTPIVDQAGHVGSAFKDDALGASGEPLPSSHMPNQWGSNQLDPMSNPVSDPENYGVFLNALVAALTDVDGSILDFPFPIGYVIPVDDGMGGYAQGFVFGLNFQVTTPDVVNLQLGFNDDLFADNTGALQVCVASSQRDMDACLNGQPDPVPEPATWALLLTGALGLLGWRRWQRS